MVPGMEDGVGEGVESDVATVPAVSAEVGLRMLGPLRVLRDGAEARLPSSRKAAALLAYLALSPEPVPRSRLCDLFWDGPNDPRGELRWTLAKLRPLVDGAGRSRLLAADDRIVLDRGGMAIDALAVEEAFARGLGGADTGWLEALAARFDGEFLEGLRIDRCPQFDAWLAAQRRRFANCRIALHEELARRLPPDGDACLGHLEIWVALSPFDVRAHAALLGALVRRGRLEAGQAHLASTRSAFQAEGIDFAPVMTAWLGARRPLAKQEAEVRAPLPAQEQKASDGRRASLAVMPFTMLASPNGIPAGPAAGLAGSLAHDIITRLARLRSLFVIARGSVFALAEAGLAPDEAAQKLGVDYFACGTIRESGGGRGRSRTRGGPQRADRVDRGVHDAPGPRRGTARRHRRPDRRQHRLRDRDRGAQQGHPEAAQRPRCLGSLSSRPVAHVPLHPERQSAGARLLHQVRGA
jgi:DNA-binding SARP family transcriptional activator